MRFHRDRGSILGFISAGTNWQLPISHTIAIISNRNNELQANEFQLQFEIQCFANIFVYPKSPDSDKENGTCCNESMAGKIYYSSNYQRVKLFMQYTRSKVFSGKNIQTYWMQLVGAPNCTESFDRNVSSEMRSTIILRCVD